MVLFKKKVVEEIVLDGSEESFVDSQSGPKETWVPAFEIKPPKVSLRKSLLVLALPVFILSYSGFWYAGFRARSAQFRSTFQKAQNDGIIPTRSAWSRPLPPHGINAYEKLQPAFIGLRAALRPSGGASFTTDLRWRASLLRVLAGNEKPEYFKDIHTAANLVGPHLLDIKAGFELPKFVPSVLLEQIPRDRDPFIELVDISNLYAASLVDQSREGKEVNWSAEIAQINRMAQAVEENGTANAMVCGSWMRGVSMGLALFANRMGADLRPVFRIEGSRWYTGTWASFFVVREATQKVDESGDFPGPLGLTIPVRWLGANNVRRHLQLTTIEFLQSIYRDTTG